MAQTGKPRHRAGTVRFGHQNDIDVDFLKAYNYDMGRRSRSREPDWLGVVPAVAAFLALAYWFVPEFRALVAGVFALVATAAGVAIIGFIAWAVYRYSRRSSDPEKTPIPSASDAPIVAHSRGNIWSQPVLGNGPTEAPRETLSMELLDKLEWRRFEELVTLYLRKTGFDARRSRVGADGGVDILLFRENEPRPFACVQCKAWHVYKVGVKPVRELFGVMASEQMARAYFVTTGGFTSEAVDFAAGKALELVTGTYLLEKLRALPQADQDEILKEITAGDYTTPTCPRCDVKMVIRHGPTGDFWGCPNFRLPWPRHCKQTFRLRDNEAE